MAGDRIERDVVIEAPIDVVWEVISQPEQIVHWFSDEAELDVRTGGEGILTFEMSGTNQPAAYHLRFEAVEPPRRLAYRWVYPRAVEPRPGNSMLVEFTLAEEGGKTRLTVVESGLDLMPWPDDEKQGYADSHGKGWARHLERLSAYAPAAPSRPVA
ncbi:MAG: SRPBCC domain-containing protein [Candidatus Dormibacteraeota bacterium]|nr:SRPBCC domain-containing protein [Candidatus Dormibacteraeota bacterium]